MFNPETSNNNVSHYPHTEIQANGLNSDSDSFDLSLIANNEVLGNLNDA